MNKELLGLLCYPSTHKPLKLTLMDGLDWEVHKGLVEPASGQRVVIRDGIPLFYSNGGKLPPQNLRQKLATGVAGLFDRACESTSMRRYAGLGQNRLTLLEDLRVQPGQRVLDAAVGAGDFFYNPTKGAHYVGIDRSFGKLQRCQRDLSDWGHEVDLCQASAERMPFRDRSFDLVYLVFGFNCLSDPAGAMSEMARVAKPGGRIVIIEQDEERGGGGLGQVLLTARVVLTGKPRRSLRPSDLIPPDMRDVNRRVLFGGEVTSLSYRTPDESALPEPLRTSADAARVAQTLVAPEGASEPGARAPLGSLSPSADRHLTADRPGKAP